MRIATCRLCGTRLEYRARRFAWIHTSRATGAPHPPMPWHVHESTRAELEERSERVGSGL